MKKRRQKNTEAMRGRRVQKRAEEKKSHGIKQSEPGARQRSDCVAE